MGKKKTPTIYDPEYGNETIAIGFPRSDIFLNEYDKPKTGGVLFKNGSISHVSETDGNDTIVSEFKSGLVLSERNVGRFGYLLPKSSFFIFHSHFQLVTEEELLRYLFRQMAPEDRQRLIPAILSDHRFVYQGMSRGAPDELEQLPNFWWMGFRETGEMKRAFSWFGRMYVNTEYDTGTVIDPDGYFNVDRAYKDHSLGAK